jgi:hypothetical protein
MAEKVPYWLIAPSQRAERSALRDSDPRVRAKIRPLFELHPVKVIYPANEDEAPFPEKTLDEHIVHTVQQMVKTGVLTEPFGWDVPAWSFEDATRCVDQSHPVSKLFDACRDVGLPAVPSITLSRDTYFRQAVAAVIAQDKRGVIIRVKPDAFHTVMTEKALPALLRMLRVTPQQVDLVIDVERITMTGTNARAEQIMALLKSADVSSGKWRSVIVAAGAFPRAIDSQGKPGVLRHVRWDWALWRQIYSESAGLPFDLGYGDYAVQAPKTDALNINPRHLNPTARIRFATRGGDWAVSSGRPLPRKAPAGARGTEWRRAARQLTALRDIDGATFSPGANQVHGVALGNLSPGNPEQWRRHATSQHVAKVVEQLGDVVGF